MARRTEDPKDAIQHAAVIYPLKAAWLVRQHRPYGRPFIIAKFIAHDLTPPVSELESRLVQRLQLVMVRGGVSSEFTSAFNAITDMARIASNSPRSLMTPKRTSGATYLVRLRASVALQASAKTWLKW